MVTQKWDYCPLFRSWLEFWTDTRHLNSEQVNIHYSDVAVIQLLTVFMLTFYLIKYYSKYHPPRQMDEKCYIASNCCLLFMVCPWSLYLLFMMTKRDHSLIMQPKEGEGGLALRQGTKLIHKGLEEESKFYLNSVS